MDISERERLKRSVDDVKSKIEARHTAEQQRADAQAARLLSRGRTASERKRNLNAKAKRYGYNPSRRKRPRFAKGGFLDWFFGMFFKTLLFSLASATGVALILGLRYLANYMGIHWVGDL